MTLYDIVRRRINVEATSCVDGVIAQTQYRNMDNEILWQRKDLHYLQKLAL